MDDEDEMLSEIEVEQAPPVVPIPAPVEPPVKRKRGRPPKNKPASECPVCTQRYCWLKRRGLRIDTDLFMPLSSPPSCCYHPCGG